MTVLVTGGTGFVGSHVAARLRASGHPVRLLVRDPAKVPQVPALRDVADLDVVIGDVTDRVSVEQAIDGCAAVVHTAAHVSLAEREAERAVAVNVGGTRHVIGAAAERKIRAVHVSSVSVFGVGHERITVETPLTEGGGGYTRSKVAAERLVRDLQRNAAPVAIVYPSAVLGPEIPDLGSTVQGLLGWIRTPPQTSSGASIVDVRDVALAIERSLEAPSGRWMLGGTFLPYPELRAAIARVTGVHRPAIPMPGGVLRVAGRIGDLVKRVVPFDYPLTYEAMSMATRSAPYDSEATCRDLGLAWRPVDTTLADSIRWLASHGDLKASHAGRLAP